MTLQKVLSSGRITLPLTFREKNKIETGDFVDVAETDSKLVITPVEIQVKKQE